MKGGALVEPALATHRTRPRNPDNIQGLAPLDSWQRFIVCQSYVVLRRVQKLARHENLSCPGCLGCPELLFHFQVCHTGTPFPCWSASCGQTQPGCRSQRLRQCGRLSHTSCATPAAQLARSYATADRCGAPHCTTRRWP